MGLHYLILLFIRNKDTSYLRGLVIDPSRPPLAPPVAAPRSAARWPPAPRTTRSRVLAVLGGDIGYFSMFVFGACCPARAKCPARDNKFLLSS